MADDPTKPAEPAPTAADRRRPTSPPSGAPAEPLKGEVSRTDAPGAGASAAPAAAAARRRRRSRRIRRQRDGDDQRRARRPASRRPRPPAAGPAAPPRSRPRRAAAAPRPPGRAGREAGGRASAEGGGADRSARSAAAGRQDRAGVHRVAAGGDSGRVTQVSYWVGDWTIIVPVAQILDVARHLRDAPDAPFDFCSDVTATDWPPRAERFDVVYCLYSTRHRHRVRVKAKVAENQPVASVTPVWPAANWLEREVYDMFGVNFTGHPDRRRILMPEDWQGFPQRKDYPLEGPGRAADGESARLAEAAPGEGRGGHRVALSPAGRRDSNREPRSSTGTRDAVRWRHRPSTTARCSTPTSS